MSYLGPLRLHFAGQFQATISTVNNDPVHYDTSRFLPRYQDPATGYDDPSQWNGWFNPRGDAAWRLLGCAVTGAWLGPGLPATDDDPIRTSLVADSDRRAPAKLVDLDPEQQLVSTIFGLEVRIVSSDGGVTLVRGHFEPAPFTDIWSRAEGGGSDIAAGAMYQSVLRDLEWGDTSSSEFLSRLRASATHGLLSIKFNVDSFNMSFTSPDFMKGRIVGTIGPAAADGPRHFVLGRQLLAASQPTPGFFVPAGGVNFCVARLDHDAAKVYLDLGNALPTTATGVLADRGELTLACAVPADTPTPKLVRIGTVPSATYTDPSWYPTTAGVVELPAGHDLTADERQMIADNPLAITTTDGQGTTTLAVAEAPGGVHVRADQFVLRLSPGDHEDVRLYATRFGRRYARARIIAILDPSQLQSQAGSPLGPVPDAATPEDAVEFPARVIADGHGMALLPIDAHDPGNPRDYIDGQVYGIRPVLEETIYSPAAPYPFNPSDFVSLLVWDDFRPREDPITWWGSVQPIMQQFENLYPVMKRFVRLGDYESLCERRQMLLLTFGLDLANPNSMPVTRDLSPAKRAAILRWLTELGPDGKPHLGVPPEPPPHLEAEVAVAEGPPPGPPPRVSAGRGGKAAAAGRRLGALGGAVVGSPGAVVGTPE